MDKAEGLHDNSERLVLEFRVQEKPLPLLRHRSLLLKRPHTYASVQVRLALDSERAESGGLITLQG